MSDINESVEMVSTSGGGPDTWMEGDISIFDDSDVNRFNYYDIELVPKLLYVNIG